MASTIKLKNGSGAPLASDLVQGEPALDLTNKRLYTEDSGGNVIEVGTNPTELQVDNINIDGNAITSTDTNGNITITPNGTGEVDISKVDIDGGAIDGTVIGGTTTAAGSFTTLQADTSLNVDGTVTADGLTVDSTGVVATFDNSAGSSNTELALRYNDTYDGFIQWTKIGVASQFALGIDGSDSDKFKLSYGNFDATPTDILTVTTGGNVGIGTTPYSWGGAGVTALDIGTVGSLSGSASDTGLSENAYYNGSTWVYKTTSQASLYQQLAGSHRFSYAASGTAGASFSFSEAMRIDSSGNLLVGKTTTDDFTIAGTQIDEDGFIAVTRDGSVTGIFNRETSDGDILQFRKDNTTEGSIGVYSGRLYVADTNVGVRFASTSFTGCNSSGVPLDNYMDIGNSSYRFKDLYLSGGVYLGGTGSANKLDDYEEGTWTPGVTIGGTTETVGSVFATYTKIGNTVNLFFRLVISTVTGTGSVVVTGIPFAPNSDSENYGNYPIYANRIAFGGGDYLVIGHAPGSTSWGLGAVKDSNVSSGVSIDETDVTAGTSQIRVSLTYVI